MIDRTPLRSGFKVATRNVGGEKNKFVLLIETDYVFKRPIRIPPPLIDYFYHSSVTKTKNKASAVGFHFNYINPHYPTLPPVMERLMRKLNDPKK